MPLSIAEQVPQSVRPGFDARWQRIEDCINLRTPDRMPVSLIGGFWFARYGGVSCRQLMYDYDLANRIGTQVMLELDPDVGSGPGRSTSWGPLWDATDFKQLEWPGHGVGENSPYQYLDREYMTADEYDDFLFDPTGFMYEKFLPRTAGVFDGLQPLGSMAGMYYTGIPVSTMMFQNPDLLAAIDRLKLAGAEALKALAAGAAGLQEQMQRGYPPFIGGVSQAPYDVLADYMRGATNMMKDMYRRPDKVLEALDKLSVLILRRTLAAAANAPTPIIMIPIHWAPDNFMSPKQFERFYWPSFRKLMLALIDHGFVPMPLWESDCKRRLETIADMPPGKCIYWFEGTDMVHANEVLGDIVALHGNVGASVMVTGTTQDVDAEVRRLAQNVFHKGGKLILSTSTPIPDEAPVANVRAMYAAARKYGG
ncbi:MAG: hypothetical protein H6978_02795 [Gammaproteobacteria bacterium]|nr:hypothetical protein [Gammaproteobacteria bacterium]